MNKIDRFLSWLFCKIGDHDWTSAANEGIKITQDQLDRGVEGFREYAIMYCKRCDTISELSYH